MKVLQFFVQVFTILAFLILGSLMLIVSFHILSFEDAISQLRQMYEPLHSFQTGLLGVSFISVGLFFARALLKQRRQSEALIYQSGIGPMVVSITAIEDVVKKVLKRFHLVKEWKTKVLIRGKDVEIKLRMVLWSGARIQALLGEIQEEIQSRAGKMLGPEIHLEIICDVQRIEDHEAVLPEIRQKKAAAAL